MAKRLIFKNKLGQKLELTNKAPFLLEKFDEGTNVNLYNNKGAGQDGSTYLGNTLDKKDVTMQIAVIEKDKEKAIEHRHTINQIFNPKFGEGELIYIDEVKKRKIKCIVNQIPHFAPEGNNIRMERCLINLSCCNPYWFESDETTNVIATWLANFSFELELVDEGIEFGRRQDTLITNVINVGEVETGMRIEFTALGTIENPSLFNINTREYIKVNKTMEAGEVIVIDTTFNKKTITSKVNNTITNIFNNLDFLNSTFLQLQVGDNYFRHDALSGLDNLECRIYFSPKYLGV